MTTLQKIITNIETFINLLVPLVFAIAFIVFIWGVFNFFIAGGADAEKRKTGRQFIMWGIIGFAVMLSVWGLVNLVVGTLGFSSTSRPALPCFKASDCTDAPSGSSNPTFTPAN